MQWRQLQNLKPLFQPHLTNLDEILGVQYSMEWEGERMVNSARVFNDFNLVKHFYDFGSNHLRVQLV